MCGGSSFTAAKSTSKSQEKSDETGVIMAVCRHGVVLKALNMYRGETYTDTHLMHIHSKELGYKIFCNDVYCQYKKWAEKVGKEFPEYASLTEEMDGILPVMHAKAHHWPCQVRH